MKRSILFITPYPSDESPSQRFRFEQYFSLLQRQHYQIKVQSFWTADAWSILYRKGFAWRKFIALFKGIGRRFSTLGQLEQFDFIFIHREALPVGPPIWEWLVSKIAKKKIIYDFDDAIWLPDHQEESMLWRLLRWRSKVGSICKWSYRVSCGNAYLCDYARKFNPDTVYNPTTVDTENHHNPDLYASGKSASQVSIGWTGSHSTLKYLSNVEPVLSSLGSRYTDLQFIVIADRPPDLNLQNLRFIPWKKQTEIIDLLQIDIGIMPLADDEWAQGKCGFKLLQYHALGIPAVASPAGVNTRIIDHGRSGYICSTQEEWIRALTALIEDRLLRTTMGQTGKGFVHMHYSVASNSENFLRLFA
jgi:glycosyltransferase involved in cell wall biosynthesis